MPDNSSNPSAKRPKRALVLSGGGGRGAYEVGVAAACRERNFDFDWIIGTSIGAINATLIAQDDLHVLQDIWCRLQSQDVYRLPNPNHLRRVVFGQKLGLLNTDPLEALLRKHVNIERLKRSATGVGFLTTDLCSLETRLITADDIHTDEELVDVLMAASAVPLLFPPRHLGGEGCWIDGGLVRNTPIQAAIGLGVSEIYAVLVDPDSFLDCPGSLVQLVSRLLEIILDHSARSGIAHVNQYNRSLELSVQNGARDWCVIGDSPAMTAGADEDSGASRPGRVQLFIIKPRNQIVGSLLEFEPANSRWLIRRGYEDTVQSCVAV
ncbi:MAG: patatin-like phospholipase family protein [Candidatus Obscuribacterales bacterium]